VRRKIKEVDMSSLLVTNLKCYKSLLDGEVALVQKNIKSKMRVHKRRKKCKQLHFWSQVWTVTDSSSVQIHSNKTQGRSRTTICKYF